MATLKLAELSKRYGKKVWGAKDVNLTVDDKEFVVFLGPSGCGKTTTMRMVAGLEEVTEGRILIDDKDVTLNPPRNREVSMVFQSYAVWPHMKVYENIAFPLKLRKMAKNDIDRTVLEVAEMVSIREYLDRYPSQLSGGQRQRVALARALGVKPKIFLMDEPLSNLDAKLRVKMRTELKAIHASTGATTIFVTHDQAEAMSMADRIVIMKDGRIVQIGNTDEVYFDSADVFVAGFIGTPPTNFLNMKIKSENGVKKLVHNRFKMNIDSKLSSCLKDYEGEDIIFGIRPESLEITKKDESDFSERILVVEPQGSHQIIAIDLDKIIIKLIAPPFPKFAPGDLVHVKFDRKRIMLFDSKTEKRVNLHKFQEE